MLQKYIIERSTPEGWHVRASSAQRSGTNLDNAALAKLSPA